jgi:hypothetical protein
MPDGYRLSLSGMGKLIDQLAQAEDRMTKANNGLRSSTAQDLGSLVVDQAGGAFQDRWEYGIGKLAESARKMVDGLAATRKHYQDAEQAIAQFFPNSGAAALTAAQANSPITRRLDGAR